MKNKKYIIILAILMTSSSSIAEPYKNFIFENGITFLNSDLVTYYRNKINPRDIMLRNEKSRRSTYSEIGSVKMLLTDFDGQTRKRNLRFVIDERNTLYRKTFLEFTDPVNISNVQAISMNTSSGNNIRYIYLPALKKNIRIHLDSQNASFLGSDFTFEDFSIMDGRAEGRKRNYSLLGEISCGNKICWVIKATPKIIGSNYFESNLGTRIIWVEQNSFVAVKEIFFDSENRPVKKLIRSNIRYTSGYHSELRPHYVSMSTYETGHKTELIFNELELNNEFDVNIFKRIKNEYQ